MPFTFETGTAGCRSCGAIIPHPWPLWEWTVLWHWQQTWTSRVHFLSLSIICAQMKHRRMRKTKSRESYKSRTASIVALSILSSATCDACAFCSMEATQPHKQTQSSIDTSRAPRFTHWITHIRNQIGFSFIDFMIICPSKIAQFVPTYQKQEALSIVFNLRVNRSDFCGHIFGNVIISHRLVLRDTEKKSLTIFRLILLQCTWNVCSRILLCSSINTSIDLFCS